MFRMDDLSDENLVVEVRHNDDSDDDSDDVSDEAFYLEKSPEFLSLCHVTRQLNINAFRELNNRETNLLVQNDNGDMVRSPDGISPIYQQPLVEQMIRERNDAAVELLFQEIKIKRFLLESAIDAYFEVHRFDKVEELLALYGNKDARGTAVFQYARLGMHNEIVPALQMYPDWIEEVQSIYACYGHIQLAEDMLNHGGTVQALINGYAGGGNFDKVNLWLESAVTRKQRYDYRVSACQGFNLADGFDDEQRLLKMLSHLDDNASRVFVVNQAVNYNFHLNKQMLLKQSKSINHIMREYQLNYEQAQVLRIPGVREWMLHARQKGTQVNRLPHDILIKTAMTLTHLSYQATEQIYLAVCRNTYNGARHSILAENTLFAKRYGGRGGTVRAARHKHELEELDARYDTKKRRIGG